MSPADVLEKVEVAIGDSGEIVVYDVTRELAERAAATLRKWMRTKDEESMLLGFAPLAKELHDGAVRPGARARELGCFPERVAAHALREVVKAKCFSDGERRAFAATQQRCWTKALRRDRKRSVSLTLGQATRLTAAFRTFMKTSDFSSFDHEFSALYVEVFSPLADASQHGALLDYGLHSLSRAEVTRFSRAFSARKSAAPGELEAIGVSLRDPCEVCAYVHIALAPPEGAEEAERCECACHAPLLGSTGGDA